MKKFLRRMMRAVWPALFLVMGCKTTFPPLPPSSDYTVQDINEDSFLIYYEGDTSKSEERIVDFALLRACHLAREHGFDYFAVLNRARPGSDGSVMVSANLYEDLKDGLVIKGYADRPKRLFVFKPDTLERMIREKYSDELGKSAGLHPGEAQSARLSGLTEGSCLPSQIESNHFLQSEEAASFAGAESYDQHLGTDCQG